MSKRPFALYNLASPTCASAFSGLAPVAVTAAVLLATAPRRRRSAPPNCPPGELVLRRDAKAGPRRPPAAPRPAPESQGAAEPPAA